ncbi:uncharacterized protein [Anoplolepis gracilipes]|uniref:uncharacterized protein n=1 Tax=Anoplolepis gracilipes TaxID=354296 RepID=UPI003BA13A33
MANSAKTEITFEDFQINERFKKLNRSLKLAVLKQEHGKSVNNREISVVTTWPSISNIDTDNSLRSSYGTLPLQMPVVKKESLPSSNILRNLFSTKNCRINREIMATSNVRQDDYNDRLVMPPPVKNTIYRTYLGTLNKVPTLPNSLHLPKPVQSFTVNTFPSSTASCTSANINNKKYLHSFNAPITFTNASQRINRIFSRWRVMLNDNYELIIKGTLECGRIAHSKPVAKRYTATCVESKYKHKYNLQGNIVDERNVLPDYVHGKFYNGFPDDWENVYQIWKVYVSQGCRVTFRWPTPITDSDDDLKSEMTEMTDMHMRNNNSFTETHESIEYSMPENPNNKSPKEKEKYYNCSTHNFQSYKENASPVKPWRYVSNSENNIIPIARANNIKLSRDEDNERNTKLNVNPLYNSKRMSELKDIIHEDKLNIIINNLADKNCSPEYINKIVKMFDWLDYAVSYKTKSECDYDSAVSASGTSFNDYMNTNKFENGIKEQCKNCMHSTNQRHGSTNNNSNQLSNPINIKPKYDNNNSDQSESEIYVGVPKIPIERVLYAKKDHSISRKIYKHKVRRKSLHNNKGIEYEVESAHTAISIANKKSLLSDKSCSSITEDEVKENEVDTTKYNKIINSAQRSQENTFCSYPETQRNNCNTYDDTSKPVAQAKQTYNAFEAQKLNLNVFRKEQKVLYRAQENSQLVADVDYTINSDIDATVGTNTQKTDGNMIASHSNLDQGTVITSKNNSNFPEKPPAFRESHKENIEQPKNEIATKKSNPNNQHTQFVNLKLKITKANSKSDELQASDINTVENEEHEQYSNIKSSEEIQKKKPVSKMASNKKRIYSTTNKENETNINSTNLTKPNATIEPSKSNKLEIKNNSKMLSAWMPKVIHYAKSKSELGLIFEGKLLNEVGHVVHRKFTTDIVLRRLSAVLIETVNHEVYELFGHLNDNKHVIPRELAKQCYNGCPANIEQFCLTWKTLQNCKIQEISEKSHDTSVDTLNTPVSSRGRRIVPTLSYWTGERVTLKDNNLVYNSGSSQKSSLISLFETSKEASKKLNTEETKKQKINSKNTSKEHKMSKSNEIPGTSKNQTIVIEKTQSSKSSKTKTANNNKRSYQSRKSWINDKQQSNNIIRQNLTFSSTDSDEEEQKVSLSKRMRIRQNTKTEAPSQYTMTLRNRHKTSPNRNTKLLHSPRKKTRSNMTYTYYKDVSLAEDFLSEVTSLSFQ